MKLLTKDRQNAAKQFIFSHARPLEKALYRHYFEKGPKEDILKELKRFQNIDGGFGQAMEPDLRAPESSALATSVALDMLRELKTSAENSLLTDAIKYVLNTYDQEKGVWRIIPKTTARSPHAPWWNQEGLEETFDNFLANPRAELVGYLFTYESLVPSDLHHQILKSVLAHFESLPGRVSGDALLCYLRLYATKNLPQEAHKQLRSKLAQVLASSVETNPGQWSSYCLKPLWTISSPDSPFAEIIPDALERNLDCEIETQCEDGSWKPHWTWGGVYPDDWKIAEQEWRGILTLRTLRTLRNFGRLQ